MVRLGRSAFVILLLLWLDFTSHCSSHPEKNPQRWVLCSVTFSIWEWFVLVETMPSFLPTLFPFFLYVLDESLFSCHSRSPEFNDFLKKSLDKNPETRPSAAQLMEVGSVCNYKRVGLVQCFTLIYDQTSSSLLSLSYTYTLVWSLIFYFWPEWIEIRLRRKRCPLKGIGISGGRIKGSGKMYSKWCRDWGWYGINMNNNC